MRRTDPIRVLIVDDSALVRSILTRVLREQSDIQVVGGAKDPYEARELIIEHRPDVIILDIEMPRMDGLTFLKKLMVHYPVPVIMCSGVAPASSQNALQALECGAVEVVAKPTTGGSKALLRVGEDLADKIHAAAVAVPRRPPSIPASATAKPTSFRAAGLDPGRHLVAIGASTGGTEAIKQLLARVPPDFPPVAIVQHMPEGFTNSFAGSLDERSPLIIREAVDGNILEVGRGFLARGGVQMSIAGGGGKWRICYGSSEPVDRHCPSVNVLFDSVARRVGREAVGVLLTGMGADGAQGLLHLRQAGAVTICQNQESCVVYGMPKVAVELGAVEHTGTPAEIPGIVVQALRQRQGRRNRQAARST